MILLTVKVKRLNSKKLIKLSKGKIYKLINGIDDERVWSHSGRNDGRLWLIHDESFLATKSISCSSCDIIDYINISIMPIVFFSFDNFVAIHWEFLTPQDEGFFDSVNILKRDYFFSLNYQIQRFIQFWPKSISI